MKLKFLTAISTEKIDYTTILREYFGVKNLRWYQTLNFIKVFNKLKAEVEQLRKLDPKTVEENPDCRIKRPESLEIIAFGSMVELQMLFSSPGERSIEELISQMIALTCYEAHTKNKFDSDVSEFHKFRKLVLDSDLTDMLGLYGWIDNQLNLTVKKWNDLFESVKVSDKHWDSAGGSMMSKFDVLNTIRRTCSDFNVNYYEALQMPYGILQASSLSDATKSFIQDNMRSALQTEMENKARK